MPQKFIRLPLKIFFREKISEVLLKMLLDVYFQRKRNKK
jgi:hypothetical protein